MINCPHWLEVHRPDGGECKKLNRTVSYGSCAACQSNPIAIGWAKSRVRSWPGKRPCGKKKGDI